ncbi:hypothetical protein HRbin21_01332 [bacterium HR21]|nr:hypothetical protein HRbin21_01332 [bacterium HR21]
MARLVAIRRVRPQVLQCLWDDGLAVYLPVEVLRDQCPCAFCQGEQVFDRYILPVRVVAPGMYELQALEPVGHYGLRAVWRDGHNTGIYPWELLRRLCEEYGQREPRADDVQQTGAGDERAPEGESPSPSGEPTAL